MRRVTPAPSLGSLARPELRRAVQLPTGLDAAALRSARATLRLVGRAPDRLVDRELAGRDPPSEVGDRPDLLERPLHERPIGHGAVARRDRRRVEAQDRLDRGRPVERIAVPEVRRGAVLQEVAGEQDASVRDRQDDVVVGVAAAEVPQLDHPAAEVETRLLVEGPRRRRNDDLPPLVGLLRQVVEELRPHLLGVLDQPGRTACLAPHLGTREDAVAEAVVMMVVGVDDPADGARELGQVRPELRALAVRGPRVDDQEPAVAAHDADRLVVEPVSAHPDPVPDLLPDGHPTLLPRAAAAPVRW